MRHSGLTRELHSSTTRSSSIRTMPTSVMRWNAAFPPVVSRSTKTRSRGRLKTAASRSSAAAIERQDRIIKIGPPVAEYSPRLPVASHRIQVEFRGEHRLTGPVGLRYFLAGWRRDERGAVERHRVLLTLLRPDAVGRDQGHDVRGGVTLHGALPVCARIQTRILRLGTDGRRVQQYISPHERHA